MKNDDKVDFVITWVDGNNKEWLKEKEQYSKLNKNTDTIYRYRDWDNLKYWFRAVEKYANWYNKIFFITWGNTPSWLNTNNPKLKIVKHADYMPSKYLPTYNSSAIELNIHRIDELSENFVLFNDDFFITDYVEKTDFFKDGKPCDSYAEDLAINRHYGNNYAHKQLNNMAIISSNFNKKEVYKKNPLKYFNFKYGADNIRTLLLSFWNDFAMIKDPHIAVALKKSNLSKLWNLEPEAFEKTSVHKFRTNEDISQYVIRFFQLMKGEFNPRSNKFGKYYNISNNNTELIKAIKKRKYKTICMNDVSINVDFEKVKKEINDALEENLKEKSSFEIT